MFDQPMHVGRPNILDPDAFHSRIQAAVDRKWLSNDGPLVLEFERETARLLEVKHCIAVANATLGIQLLVHAMGIRRKVIMPSFTFIATPHAVLWQGAQPMFCDVQADNHTLDAQKVRAAMSPDVDAILGVHLWGGPCDIDALQGIADEWRVPLIFDAAHAFGSSYKGRKLGSFGAAEVFSLHATKGINGIESGFITTANDELAARLKALRNYGFTEEGVIGGLGINAKMNEISAAMALSNIPHFESLSGHNHRIRSAYEEGLARVPGVRVHSHEILARNDHYAVFSLASPGQSARDKLLDMLKAENVLARRYFWPGCHRSPPYRDGTHVAMPVTERLVDTVFQLPTGMQLDEADASAIAACVKLWVELGEAQS